MRGNQLLLDTFNVSLMIFKILSRAPKRDRRECLVCGGACCFGVCGGGDEMSQTKDRKCDRRITKASTFLEYGTYCVRELSLFVYRVQPVQLFVLLQR